MAKHGNILFYTHFIIIIIIYIIYSTHYFPV